MSFMFVYLLYSLNLSDNISAYNEVYFSSSGAMEARERTKREKKNAPVFFSFSPKSFVCFSRSLGNKTTATQFFYLIALFVLTSCFLSYMRP